MSSRQHPLHGGEVYALARAMHTSVEKLLDFSCNANIFAAPITERLITRTPYPFLHYPDTSCPDLCEAIARHEGLAPSRILPGNGATDLIWTFLRHMAPNHILFVGPVFSEYIKACNSLGITYSILTPPVQEHFGLGAQELQKLWDTQADLIVLCSPNNPAAITYPNFFTVLNMIRAPRVLLDTCYREFLHGTNTYESNRHSFFLEHIRPGVSLFTLNSFTKFFCCPGVRLGYLLGDKKPIEQLNNLMPSWSVSPFAQIMGVTFLDHIEEYRTTLTELNAAVSATARDLRRISLFDPEKIFEGPGFLCCGLQKGISADSIFDDLLGFGILIRSCDSIPGMPAGFIRLQAREEKDREHLMSAFSNIWRQKNR